jgi:beta-N-acetylhexosaminidase
MTAHVLYPKLDSTYPATLSHTVISDLLRDEIGYSGVVITDDLNMKGVSGSRSVEECSVRALKAGCDLLLICNSPDAVIRSRNAVSDALREGLLSTSSISAALGRITSLIRAYEPSFGVPDVRRAREYFQVDKTETSATV